MTLNRINGRSGTADVLIGTQSYKTVLRRFVLDSTVPQDDVTTFSTETGPAFDPGVEMLHFSVLGFGTYGAAQSGPLIPAPQNVALTFTVATGCTVTGNGNFSRASISREVSVSSVITGEGTMTGAFAVTWDRGP
jgi:hypothetical protein